jgi:hypothetical protein
LRGLSMVYTDELRRFMPSGKCPDRFSRNVACRANPLSFRELMLFENVDEIGEGASGDGGEWPEDPVLVELVDGLSLPLLASPRDCRNALKTDVFEKGIDEPSPKVVELSLTYDASVAGAARELKTCGFSDEKESYG